MNNQDIYKCLKQLTLENLIKLIFENETMPKSIDVNDYRNYNQINTEKSIYSIDELIKKYPFFTRYSINKAIQEDGLPSFNIGKKRYFDKYEIDSWLTKNDRRINKKEYL